MPVSERRYEAVDETMLYERSWKPDGAAKGVVVIVHGYAEHVGRYDHVAAALTDAGYAVHAADLRGHGRSEGLRAFVRSSDQYLDDLDLQLADVRTRYANVPLFVLGHSMGGTIVALHAIERRPEVRGLILSGPSLKGPRSTPAIVARLIAGLVSLLGRLAPKLGLTRLDSALVSRDPEVVSAYDADPLVYRGRMKAGTALTLTRAVREIQRHMEMIEAPLLLLHGTEDGLTDPDGSRQLHERSHSSDKTLRLYEGLYHEIFNEPEKAQVLSDVVAWLNERTASAKH